MRPTRSRGEVTSATTYIGPELRRILVLSGLVVAVIIVLAIIF